MQFDPTLLNIGRTKQTFIDDLLIESVENVQRRWYSPEKATEPLIQRDRPWEHIPYFSCNTFQVLKDNQDGLYKCLYTDWEKPQITARDTAVGNSHFNMLYAESEDGLEWRKPTFDLHPRDGQDTNIVVSDGYDPGLVFDCNESDPQKRFKMVYTQFLPGGDVEGVKAATSPDLVHWSPMEADPILGRQGSRLDDVVIISYDPLSRMYIMTTRHYDMYAVKRNLKNPVLGHWTPVTYPSDWRRMNRRRVWQAESFDLLHWGEPFCILAPEDGTDDLDETFYGLSRYQMGSVTIGFLNTLHQTTNTMDVRLVYSRNGKDWHHLNKRQPFLAPGGEPRWDAYMNTIPTAPIEAGAELHIYHGGAQNHHDWWITGAREGVRAPEATDIGLVSYALGLAKLRMDGFCALEAIHARPGIVITRALISDGTRLLVNARCRKGGSIQAEIVDVEDNVVPGFSRQECDAFSTDSVCHTFTWRGKTEIPVASTVRAQYPHPERDRMRKIRFYLDTAELFSFRLE